MTPEDVPKLQRALQQAFPSVVVTVEAIDYGNRLRITTDNDLPHEQRRRHVLLTPANMSYTALSWPEWLHRAATALSSRRPL